MTFALATILAASPICARADVAVSSNDGHTTLNNGVLVAAHPNFADTLAVIDLSAFPPHIKTIIDVPGSVVGPPTAVTVAPDESWAIVTSATKPDAGSPSGNGPDDRVSVVDLKASPPKVVQTLTAGAGASTVRISPDGSLALVANRGEGTVSVFTIAEKRLTPAGKVELGNPKAGPSGIGFTRDGSAALVSRDGDSMVSVLHIEHAPGGPPEITIDPRPITTGVRPYTLDVNAAGTLAAVANMGRGDGDIDTVSLIDLTQTPFRTVETLAVGESPEGIKFSPDGAFLAVAAQEGTTKAPNSPFYRDFGKLMMFAVRDPRMRIAGPWLRGVAEAPIGRWSQGIAFFRDGKTLLVQEMGERRIAVFRWQDNGLTEEAPMPTEAGPAAIGTPWP